MEQSSDNKRPSLDMSYLRHGRFVNIKASIKDLRELKDIVERKFSMKIEEIYQNLEATRDELIRALDGLSKEQLNRQIASSSWSICQVCQHLAKTEELYVVAIMRGLKSKEDSLLEKKSLDFLLDRSKRLTAPDIVKPTDEILEYEEIIERLSHSREKLYKLLNSVEDPSVLSKRQFTHPVFKEMLLIEWVKSVYLHEQRHTKQIHEIKAGF
ncbi:hypothetical protein J40TS1_37640 [Paenibacillus montaniterrae]|uniref:DinB-like domain-containing protein n=1 Tax=Paenibacillus montaniterrae TaxID=429341 RepID=A0A919YP99_9BACL|nr:DinB family protein [Paenibacillus montaniterrae]GIP18122.1 hypothetical protein J40TS1_37640 [Paenibacillus montaniterrae]